MAENLPLADDMTPTTTSAEKVMYREQLRGALIYRKKFGREERYRGYIRILAHNFYADKVLETDTPTVNLIAARVRAQPPKLAFGIPQFEVTSWGKPPTPNSEVAWSKYLSLMWELEGMDDVTRSCTLDWATFGLGIGFIGYEEGFEGDIIEEKRRLFGIATPEFTEKVAKLGGGKVAEFMSSREHRTIAMMLKQRIFMDRVSVLDFAIDPCSNSWGDAQYMARRLALPKERALLMFGSDCPNAESINNVALYQDSTEDDPFGEKPDPDLMSKLPDAVKRVVVWELWNITTRKTVYLDDSGKVIGNHVYPWRSAHPGFPFIPMIWDEVPDNVYPEGLAAAIKPLNDELHLSRKRQIAEQRKAIRKYRVDPALKNSDAVRELKSDIDGGMVFAEEGQVESLDSPGLPPEMFAVEDRIRHDVDEVTHTSPYDAAGMPAVKRTATEASLAQGSSDAIASFRKASIEKFAAAAAERIMALAAACIDEPVTLSLMNQDESLGDINAKIDFAFIPADHIGYYRIKTTEDTMLASAKDIERQQLTQAFDLFNGQPWFKSKEAAAHIYSTMPSVRDPFKFIMTDEEMAQAQAQAQAQAESQQPPVAQVPGMEGMPQDPFAGQPQFGFGGDGMGSGNLQADMLSGMFGAMAPNPQNPTGQ